MDHGNGDDDRVRWKARQSRDAGDAYREGCW